MPATHPVAVKLDTEIHTRMRQLSPRHETALRTT